MGIGYWMKLKQIWLSNEVLIISILAKNLSMCYTIAYQNLLNFVIGLNSNKQATVFEDRATLSQLEFALGHFTATVSFVTGSDSEKRFEC